MICPKCSATVPDDSVFCNYCGKRLVASSKKGKPKSRGNGQGTAFKRGSTWTAMVTIRMKDPPPLDLENPDPAVRKPRQLIRKTKGGFKTKAEALAYCQTLKNLKDESDLTLQQVYEAWEPWYSPRVDPSTMNGYRAAFNYFSDLKKKKICTITAGELQACMDNCPKGKRTHQNMKVVAGLVWKYARDKHIVSQVESENLYTGKGKSKKREALTDKEVEQIRQAMETERYADYIYCLIYLGFRPGEMLEIKKEQVIEHEGNLFITEGKKTDAGRGRIVPVHQKIENIIRSRLYVPGTDFVFPQYVFTRKKDPTLVCFKEMTDNYFRENVFKPMMERLGIAEGKVPYGARHTFSNKLKRASGEDIDKAALMGHSDYTFTQTRYQSTDLDELHALVESME